MKIKILTLCFCCILTISACEKNTKEALSLKEKATSTATTKFNQSDTAISKYLDQLDNSNASKQTLTQILCHDYPTEYKKNYMPALLELEPKDYTPEKLLEDLDIALTYYKDTLNIECDTD